MKFWIIFIIIYYSLAIALDWFAVVTKTSPEWCQGWMDETPWYSHIVFPGFGLGCIDVLIWDKKDGKE